MAGASRRVPPPLRAFAAPQASVRSREPVPINSLVSPPRPIEQRRSRSRPATPMTSAYVPGRGIIQQHQATARPARIWTGLPPRRSGVANASDPTPQENFHLSRPITLLGTEIGRRRPHDASRHLESSSQPGWRAAHRAGPDQRPDHPERHRPDTTPRSVTWAASPSARSRSISRSCAVSSKARTTARSSAR